MRSSARHSSRGCLDLTITSSWKPLSQGLVTFLGPQYPPWNELLPCPLLVLLCSHLCSPYGTPEPPIWTPRAGVLSNGIQQMKSVYGMEVCGSRHSTGHGKRIPLPGSPTHFWRWGRRRELANHHRHLPLVIFREWS